MFEKLTPKCRKQGGGVNNLEAITPEASGSFPLIAFSVKLKKVRQLGVWYQVPARRGCVCPLVGGMLGRLYGVPWEKLQIRWLTGLASRRRLVS
jgi:hypothetical protein